jgi:hypothetical protein
VDGEGRVITANDEGLAFLGKDRDRVEGRLGGDVFECRHAREPGGCGNTTHCLSCTIRLTVMHTLETGYGRTRVRAYPDLHRLSGDERILFFISTEKVGDAVFLRIDGVENETIPPPA